MNLTGRIASFRLRLGVIHAEHLSPGNHASAKGVRESQRPRQRLRHRPGALRNLNRSGTGTNARQQSSLNPKLLGSKFEERTNRLRLGSVRCLNDVPNLLVRLLLDAPIRRGTIVVRK